MLFQNSARRRYSRINARIRTATSVKSMRRIASVVMPSTTSMKETKAMTAQASARIGALSRRKARIVNRGMSCASMGPLTP